MSTYEDEVRSSLKAQFNAGELFDMGDATNAFNSLSRFFPISGSKIDWQHVPGSIAFAEREATLQHRRFVEFFDEMRFRFHLTGPVTYAGDSATDFAVSGAVDAIRNALPILIEVPQHHYFMGPDCSWCICMTMEGDMGFGRSIFSAVSSHTESTPGGLLWPRHTSKKWVTHKGGIRMEKAWRYVIAHWRGQLSCP